MFYRKNMGPKERWVRGVLGGGMVVGAFALLGATPLALMVAGGGVMRDMEQLTITEVATRLAITREAAKSRIHRARALVREYLQPDAGGQGGAP
jgi:sigma-70-like protein